MLRAVASIVGGGGGGPTTAADVSVDDSQFGILTGTNAQAVFDDVDDLIIGVQPDIQFQDEGVNEGTAGGITTVNFMGAGVTADAVAGTLTVTIPGGSADLGTGQFGITIDGGGSAISTGVAGYLQVPYAMTITGWTIFSKASGNAVIDVWKDTYANALPTVADTITASAKPTLSSSTKATSSTLTGWTTTVNAGDVIAFNVDSATVSWLHIIVYGDKT